MSAEDLERYETEIELQLYQEYRAVLPMFKYVVETERRFYLANDYKMEARGEGARTWFEIELGDAWVWDVDPASWERRACQIAGRSLTQAEWQIYLPDRPYQPTCGS